MTNSTPAEVTIDLVRIVSAPTYDADDDGTRDGSMAERRRARYLALLHRDVDNHRE